MQQLETQDVDYESEMVFIYLAEYFYTVRITNSLVKMEWLSRVSEATQTHHRSHNKHCKLEFLSSIEETLAA